MGNYIMSKFSSTEPTVTRSCEKKRKLVATANSSSDDEATGADEENDDLENSINLILNYSQVRPDSGQTFNVATRKSNSIRTFYPAIVSETDHGSPQSSRLSPGSRQSAKCQIKPELIRPIRKKMKSTSNYIYSTLFLNGENSDICVRALNRTWNLHKLYLCQSPYFDSMFKGAKWKESSEREIEIAIPDENISEKSLFVSFGSFYKEDIEILPIEVINVLACASLFSLDGLIAQCEQIMLENINAQTVLAYHDASLVYGVSRVSEKCIKWLSLNLMINDEIRLESIGLTLFERVLASSELMVIQVETDLYSLCKKWLYYQLNKSEATGKLDSKSWQKVTNDFYRTLIGPELTRVNLLDDEAYAKYVPVFRKIRMQHIINDLQSLKLIHNDRIIPVAWIEAYYSKNWLNLLFIDQDRLSNEFEIDPAEFEANCMRFGRILNNDQPATWRWVGFNYGIDLLMAHTNRSLSLKRNTLSMHSPYKGLLSNKTVVRVYYLIKIVELDKFGNEIWSKHTDLTCLDLNKNEDKVCLTIDVKVKFPIVLNLFVSYFPFRLNYLQPLNNNNSTSISNDNASPTTSSASSSN